MKPYLYVLLLITFTSSCEQRQPNSANEAKAFAKASANSSYKPAKSQNSEWEIYKVRGGIVEFRNHKKFDTKLCGMEYIGQVADGTNPPFLVFSGQDCTECDESISVYIEAPSDALLSERKGDIRYAMPGRETDYETDQLLYRAKAFYGEVLPGIYGVLWYQRQLMENNSWKQSLFLVSIANGSKKESLLKDSGQLKQTLKLMALKHCREIKGIDYTSEP